MKALTPGGLTRTVRSLRLRRLAVPTFRPQPRDPSSGRFVSRLSAGGCSRLRHPWAGSPRDPAETGSLSYGLLVHLRLLSTPPSSDAVTFDYRAATNPGTDLHRADQASSRTHSWPGLARPSGSARAVRDGRVKPGHDEVKLQMQQIATW